MPISCTEYMLRKGSTLRLSLMGLGFGLGGLLGVTSLVMVLKDTAMYYHVHSNARELVDHRPSFCQGSSSSQLLLQQEGVDAGVIDPNTCLYTVRGEKASEVYLYAWIWSASVTVVRNEVILATAENVRAAANAAVIGRLKSGAKGLLIHKNQKESWLLCKFVFDSTAEPSIRSLANAVVTDTTTVGGEVFTDLPHILELGMAGFCFGLVSLMALSAGARKWMGDRHSVELTPVPEPSPPPSPDTPETTGPTSNPS